MLVYQRVKLHDFLLVVPISDLSLRLRSLGPPAKANDELQAGWQ